MDTDLDMNNHSIGDVTSIDGGGDTIIVYDKVKITSAASPFGGLEIESTDTVQSRVGFDLKTNFVANAGDVYRFNFQGDNAIVNQSVWDASVAGWIPMTWFYYLVPRLDVKCDLDLDDHFLVDIKRYSQNAEPALAVDGQMAIWRDADDHQVWLLYKDPNEGQVKVQLV